MICIFLYIYQKQKVMLATTDDGDLPGHVSGFAQFTLFIFMLGIQIALIVQEWFLRSPSSYFESIHIERYQLTQCSAYGYNNESMAYKFSYVTLLLLLQIFISPFIVKSKRNYREGLLFCIASLVFLLVWAGWASLYVFLPHNFGWSQWREISICSGLLLCPFSMILVIFVPKVSC